MTDLERCKIALKEMIARNLIRNDKDVYLLHLAHWALGVVDDRPTPEDYGQEVINDE